MTWCFNCGKELATTCDTCVEALKQKSGDNLQFALLASLYDVQWKKLRAELVALADEHFAEAKHYELLRDKELWRARGASYSYAVQRMDKLTEERQRGR